MGRRVDDRDHPQLGVEVAYSPEFLQEGFAVEDVLRPNRIVVGVKSEWANSMLYSAHKGVFDLAATEDREVPLVVTDFATAELVKVAANAFLATKISFINAMAEVCEATGGDVVALADAIGRASATASYRPGWASAAAASPRTSAPSRPARRSSAPVRRCASCTRST